uniref:fatty acyl-CoA reductase 1 n=1 Tax=Ciona intestinalis TaxID=7719 RepID=UPI000180CB25|nr:fatty acyl-CoA reductase 1 [Ciona intestinalis]XP_026693049.1 fatty acyl-CoA reductase 1 [Ciona intestinalis]|eukprot:XP_009860455.1 fatty acyl-CoA reductase 1 [Ciona intestinalis]
MSENVLGMLPSQPEAPADRTCPTIAEFYAGKTVALTGGTGFLGQGVIEKLLRCCPEIKKIILFIRHKRNVEPKDRLSSLVELPAFDNLWQLQPNFVEKLSFVSCDLEADDLGLSKEDRKTLQNEVNVFYHSAATLKFNEQLRLSFEVNVQCVRRLLKLCKGMHHLHAFVHVSTAYSHCNRYTIDEKVYDTSLDYHDLENSFRWMNDSMVEKITPDVLGNRPNTYTLTKALAEDAVCRESGNLPICIVRPSMIIPAWQEPMPGWCTNLYGPTAFFVAYGKGVLRSVIADKKIVADLIPVDLVVNGVIAAALKTAVDHKLGERSGSIDSGKPADAVFTEDEMDVSSDSDIEAMVSIKHLVPIYNLTTGCHNPLYISDLVTFGKKWYSTYPLDPLRMPSITVTCNKYLHNASIIMLQTIPAYIYDMVLAVCSKRRKMVKLNSKLNAGMSVMEYFFTNEWRWKQDNTTKLQKSLTPKDQKNFNFDARCFSWSEQIKHYVIGTRQFLVKENMNEYPKARKAVDRLRMMARCVNIVAAIGIYGVLSTTGITKFLWRVLTFLFSVLGFV